MATGVTQLSHWGAYLADVSDNEIVHVRPHPLDRDPSPLLGNIPGSTTSPARIKRPAIRKGWLENGPGATDKRGIDPFVEVEWDQALDLLALELDRVVTTHGPAALYGGSYGWASAGRFHHAQSHLRRFLNLLGGYTASVNSYSLGASPLIMRHVLGGGVNPFQFATNWQQIIDNADLVVSFGGLPVKNTFVSPGGVTTHEMRANLHAAADNGVRFVSFSPLKDDLAEVPAEWVPTRPGSDVAVMLGIAHALVAEGLHDRAFLDRFAAGYETFERYLLGETDGIAKTPAWAEEISGVPSERIVTLARKMAASRTLVTVGWALQRAQHGEQPVWMAITLAAMLGEIGLAGRGFGHGYGSMAEVGRAPGAVDLPSVPQGKNPVSAFIPVARVADMLLHPGEPFDYDGQQLMYPDIRLVYWSGGNPFHHHQDLGRLRRAMRRPETIVVHEPFWTGMARHADIVLPTTLPLERNDLGGNRNDPNLIAMYQAVEPHAEARDDFAIFSGAADRLGFGQRYHLDKSPMAWIRDLYEDWSDRVEAATGANPPTFDEFWETGTAHVPVIEDLTLLGPFRNDPEGNPLRTPSGKIEISSDTIAGFGYDDCRPYPSWFDIETLRESSSYPLRLVANNPSSRLHSQLDMGKYSQSTKVQGREPVRMHMRDAEARGITTGDIVLVRSDRGRCLAGAAVTDEILPGVVQLSTGAWYDPIDWADPDAMCVHGNPNVLTEDIGTSKLAQGCSGQLSWVEIEKWTGDVPPIRAFDPPRFAPSPISSC
jgi:biotin/methionine sulfoxide reductase